MEADDAGEDQSVLVQAREMREEQEERKRYAIYHCYSIYTQYIVAKCADAEYPASIYAQKINQVIRVHRTIRTAVSAA